METSKYSQWVKYTGLGAQLLVLLALAVFAGIRLDKKLNMEPLLTIALPLLALVVSFYKLIKETGKKNKNDRNTK